MKGIGVKELAFVGYAVTDMAVSRKFYAETLGLEESSVIEHEGQAVWVEFTIPGGQTIAITRAGDEWQPSANGGGVCLELHDLDAAVAFLAEAGVAPRGGGIHDFPVCRLALISDPSGNTIALHQKKPNHPECSH